jgi:hypothetical protein
MSWDKDWEVQLALQDPNNPIHDYIEAAMSVPFDYHRAEPIKRQKVGGPVHWQAYCKCGWVGPVRDTHQAAEDDCLAHDTTEND